MKKALKDFYFHFHTKQHYFLCHDILEEAWKDNEPFRKDDAVVSLILLATGCYHFRRANHKGAMKSFSKALNVIQAYTNDTELGIELESYKTLLLELIEAAKNNDEFVPIQLPLTPTMHQAILKAYPNYTMTDYTIKDSYIVNHHLERDRSEVTAARLQALHERRNAKM
ncbi:DUF309 domain-containing protein [Staphylococcus xylosus]|uniref:DUF309 domain-containing protein n=1 Tax=Staphylococcus xylosus TaxID=1288 RepID=A0A5R9B5U9_STAXY|nr:DUF309 domain-containing protein [Staphylococcus xylosus]AID42727.1 DUF309 domain-containing protein [Staphylococcus xylosus]MBE6179559.1 DUF309 domain-containing protein [Staphylococcus xylosus]MBG3873172.1 DUF309 domain-containing protein [Staphylococcus xylosus]MBM6638159.1 DUF309 domain-containing protein [Staphylococcus xylosus]MBU6131786.1 DUF309 domain-containing protein [Staphylococcus xylosus]